MKLLREKLYLCEDEEENDLASTIEIKDDEIEDTQEEQSQEVELDNQDVQEISDEESSLDMPVNDELQTIGASSMITDLITQSWEKVNTFNSIIASLVDMETSQDVIDIVKDVENDLFISIGQLQKALELISGQTVEVTKDNLSDETIKDEEEVKVEDEVSINDTEDSEEASKEEEEEDEKKEESLNEESKFIQFDFHILGDPYSHTMYDVPSELKDSIDELKQYVNSNYSDNKQDLDKIEIFNIKEQ